MGKITKFLSLSFCLAAQLIFLSLPARADEAQLLSPRLQALARALSSGDGKAADIFWQDVTRNGAPLIEPAPDGRKGLILMTFLWRTPAGQPDIGVRVQGTFRQVILEGVLSDGWGCPVPRPLSRVGDSNIWARSYIMPSSARFSYYFVADARKTGCGAEGEEQLADPVNPRSTPRLENSTFGAETGIVSYAEGPDAQKTPFLKKRPGVAAGKVATVKFDSKVMANRRDVWVYTPPGYNPAGAPYNVALLFDGKLYLALGAATTFDNMLADGVIPPLVVVLVDSNDDRDAELTPNPKFQSFIADELMPWVRAHYAISADPRRAVVGGASWGGLTATFTGLSHPELFGNVLSQSGGFYWWPAGYQETHVVSSDTGWLTQEYARHGRLPLRFYMEVGSQEAIDMVFPNRYLRDLLRDKGHEVTYQERVSGHDQIGWRDTLPNGLIALIGTKQARENLFGPDQTGKAHMPMGGKRQ